MDPIVIAGAGIAGISTAFHLSELGVHDVVVCDPLPPLTLTSDKSTECYRNWWPSADMVSLMNRSIDLLEVYDRRSGRAFNLNRRGYLYVTTSSDRLEQLISDGEAAERHGAGTLRRHDNNSAYRPHEATGVPSIDGADLLEGDVLHQYFPHVSHRAIGGLHARRAGWLSAQQFGAWMLEEAKARGARVIPASVDRIVTKQDRVHAVGLSDGSTIDTTTVIDAAGPLLGAVARLAGIELPVHSEAHFKVAFRDPAAHVPRDAPMMIWCDPQTLEWSPDEIEGLAAAGRSELAAEMPAFCHGRPEGPAESPWFVALWEYHRNVLDPVWPMIEDPLYPEVVLRGMSAMLPALEAYLEHMPRPFVDGGYYTKAPDNKPIVGPTPLDGFHVAGALSGFGVMASAAVGELAALHATGAATSGAGDPFGLSRFDDPGYLASVGDAAAGQL